MSEVNEQRSVRAFIVLIALLQGLGLYLAETGLKNNWWPFSELSGCIYWYTLVLSVPTVMIMTVRDLHDPRFWQHVAGFTLVYAALAAWAAWNATGAPDIQSGAVLWPFGLWLAAAVFVLLPYLQCRLTHAKWKAPYTELFEHAWQNGLTVVLVVPFVGICWAVLILWGQLFALVKINFFRELFEEKPFVYLATGTMVGLGILIARTQHRPLQIVRQIVFAVFRGLLPLLAFIAVLFLLTLPIVGLQPLWETRSATAIITILVGLMVLFVNAVYQDGQSDRPYPAPLLWLVRAGLLTLPAYAVIALYAMWLRVEQYGWTAERVCMTLVVVLLAAHAFAYAYAAVTRSATWLAPLARSNVYLSWLALALIVATNSPLIDPYRISINSQLARLNDGHTPASELDLPYLRFESGRRGYAAMLSLRDDPRIVAEPLVLAAVERELNKTRRWGRRSFKDGAVGMTVEQARALIHPASGAAPADERWLKAMIDGRLKANGCLQTHSDCVLLTPDLDGDGTAEHLLCNLEQDSMMECQLATLESDQWINAGSFTSYGIHADLMAAVRQGQLQLQPRRWPDLIIGGKRLAIRE